MRVDERGTDAGRQSLTDVGGGGARAGRAEACATCGAYFGPADGECPSCGRARGAFRSARRRPGAAPAAQPPTVTSPGGSAAPDAASPSGAAAVVPTTPRAPERAPPAPLAAAPEARPHEPAPLVRDATWGERFIAWSALVVLAIAAVFFVQRIGELPAGHGRDEASVAAGPAAPPAPLARATPAAAGGADTATATDNLAPEPDRAIASRRAHRAPPVPVSSVRKPARVAEPRPAPPAPAADERAPIPQPSRWERMREEIALCGPDGFLARMVCELEVRTRYCSGFWGSAAECPSGRTADYGN